MVTLADIQAARERIAPYVRRTPVIEATSLRRSAPAGHLFLKLECLQVIGSFKARGAVSKLKTMTPEQVSRGVTTASGGNHGLGVAYAGWLAKSPATIYLASNVPQVKQEKLEAWGARVIRFGTVWDEANAESMAVAERDSLAYLHPFADPAVIAGQGTIGLELFEDLKDIDVLLVAVGGGGLISGVSIVARAMNPKIKIYGIAPVGCQTVSLSVQEGRLVTIDKIETKVSTLAPRRIEQITLDIIRKNVDEMVAVSDEDMLEASRWLYQELGVAAELSGAASMAALLTGRVKTNPSDRVCVLVCGAGADGVG